MSLSAGTAVLDQLLADVDAAEGEISKLLADLVRFPTVNYGDGHAGMGGVPNGNETACARFLLEKLEAEGISGAVYESAATRGNLIARLPGDGRHPGWRLSTPSLLFMAHLDVVPVEDPQRWTHPPFDGVIDKGIVYGRGSHDAKSLAACEAMAMILLKRRKATLGGDVALLAAADEESGGRFGAGWVASQADLAPHVKATVALNEGGGGSIRSARDGGGARGERDKLAYGFATGEKGRLEVRVHVEGKPGHASAPWRAENALERAGIVLERLRGYRPELDTSHPLFAALPTRYGLDGAITGENVEASIERLEHEYPSVAGAMRSASRLTVVPTMLSAGIKSNSIPASCTVVCDSRTLPHQDAEYVRAQLEDHLSDLPWARVEVETTAISNASDYDHAFREPALEALRVALRRPDVELVPALCGGFTDSRFLRPLGTQVYDFMPLHPEAEDRDTGVHGTNERIEVAGLVARTRFLVAAACLYLRIE